MNPDLEWVAEYVPMARRIAESFARSYRRNADEVEQEILLDLCERSHRLAEPRSEALIYSIMKHRATGYCKGERNREFYLTDQYVYTPGEVAALLPAFLAGDGACRDVVTLSGSRRMPTLDEYDEYGQAAEMNPRADGSFPAEVIEENAAERLDLASAFDRLSPKHQAVLYDRFIGEYAGDGNYRKQVTRAIDALTERMNGFA